MTTKLSQKDLKFNEKEFTLTEYGLEIKQKDLFSSSEHTIAFDDIGIRTIKTNKGIIEVLLATIGLTCVSIVMLVLQNSGEDIANSSILLFMGLALFFFLVFILSYKKSLYLVSAGNANAIEFIQNKPSNEQIENFIETVKIRRNEILNNKYGNINSSLSYEQNYKNIIWLLNNEAISNIDFDIKVNELELKFNAQQNKRIGFDINKN